MRFFFLHNPKAGGTSLHTFLAEAAPGFSYAPVFGNAPNDYRRLGKDFSAFAGFDTYFGHYGFEVYAALGEGHALITNFRDPVRRVHSIYRYWRNNVDLAALTHLDQGDADVVRSAQQLSFSDFIRQDSDDLRAYTHNFHARQLYRDGWNPDPLDAAAVDLVKRRISAMPWFYIAESAEVSIYLFGRAFGTAAEEAISRQNESRGTFDGIALADAAYLAERNCHDYAIYAHAWREQAQRLAAAAQQSSA